MKIVITGSIAFDYLMSFPGSAASRTIKSLEDLKGLSIRARGPQGHDDDRHVEEPADDERGRAGEECGVDGCATH